MRKVDELLFFSAASSSNNLLFPISTPKIKTDPVFNDLRRQTQVKGEEGSEKGGATFDLNATSGRGRAKIKIRQKIHECGGKSPVGWRASF